MSDDRIEPGDAPHPRLKPHLEALLNARHLVVNKLRASRSLLVWLLPEREWAEVAAAERPTLLWGRPIHYLDVPFPMIAVAVPDKPPITIR